MSVYCGLSAASPQKVCRRHRSDVTYPCISPSRTVADLGVLSVFVRLHWGWNVLGVFVYRLDKPEPFPLLERKGLSGLDRHVQELALDFGDVWSRGESRGS